MKGFALIPGTKKPAAPWKDPSTWLPIEDFGNDTFGLPTGEVNGFWVLDIDVKNGVNGLESLRNFDRTLPETRTVRTPSGGYHLYFRHVEGVRNRTGVLPGVDVRGEGGYVCAGGPYELIDNSPIVDAPQELLDLVLAGVTAPPTYDEPITPLTPADPRWPERMRMAEAFLATAPPAISGKGGQNALWVVAKRLCHTLELPIDTALMLVEGTGWNVRCEPPWSVEDLRRTLANAQNSGGISGTFPEDFLRPAVREPVTGDYRRAHSPDHQYKVLTDDIRGGERGKLAPLDMRDIGATFSGPAAHPDWLGVFQYDRFKNKIIAVDPPIHLDAETSRLTDRDVNRITYYMAVYYNSKVTDKQVLSAIELAAEAAAFHPILDYLDALPPVPAEVFEGIAGRLWGADDDDALESEIFKRQLVACVRRARNPGTKVDEMLILHGGQGLGKSRLLQKLAGKDYFLDQLPNLDSKDAMGDLVGIWIVEDAELSGHHRSEVTKRKSFQSKTMDTFRPAYGRMTQDFPRTAVFFGSTNDDIILDDPTGSRRYNVVHVKKDIDVEGLDRDALWSAANVLERQGYTHYFDRRSQQELDRARQQHRTVDPWEPQVTEWVRQKHKSGDIVSVSGALEFCEPETVKHTPALDKRIRSLLRSVCGASQVRRVGEKITRSYVAP